MDISVQVVNYNTKSYLKDCLRDVLKDFQDSSLKYEILVADNNSDDNLDDLADFYKNQPVQFFKLSHNGGYGAGNNFLATKGTGRYILALNPDLKFIEPRTVERLFQKIASDPFIKVIGPKLVIAKGETQRWDHGELLGIAARIANGAGSSYWRSQGKSIEAAWVSGAVFLVERKIFQEIGGFDESFFLYKEEEDLCLSIRSRGGHILYYPSVAIMHYGSVVATKAQFFSTSTDYFIRKHFRGKWKYSFLKIFHKFINETRYPHLYR